MLYFTDLSRLALMDDVILVFSGEFDMYEEGIKSSKDKRQCEKVMKIGYPKLHKVNLFLAAKLLYKY